MFFAVLFKDYFFYIRIYDKNKTFNIVNFFQKFIQMLQNQIKHKYILKIQASVVLANLTRSLISHSEH